MTKIGPYTLYTIETGRFGLDGGAMFGIIPQPLWSRRIEPDARNRIPLHMRCLLLEGDGRLILIDNGLGDKYDAKFASIYAVDDQAPTLDESLAQAGFGRDEITDVILTHLHFDHAGGTTRRTSDGLAMAFPNATIHVQRDHWAWASAPNPREQGSFLAENLDPLAASGQLALVEGAGALFPGVSVRTVHGHTEAQQIVMISDDARTLVFVADLLPTSAHLAPVWGMGYDVRPLVTIEEKGLFLEEAITQGWTLFFEHDPHVVVAQVESGPKGPQIVAPRPLTDL
ncbi:MAG: MBL fold metallo-hydrolase [Bacteroidota bacterium]